MSQLNSLAITSSRNSHSEHPFRKAVALVLATIATSPALAAAQVAQRVQQQSAPMPTMASNTIPSLPGVSSNGSSATPSSSTTVVISDHPPGENDLSVLNKPYFYRITSGQVFGCMATMTKTPALTMMRKVICAPASPDIQAQAQGR